MNPIEAKMKLHWGSQNDNHKCTYITGNILGVHQHEGGLWWFTDETQTDEFGGYCLKEQAEEAAKRYGEQL